MRIFNYSSLKEQKWDSDILGLVAAIYKEAGKQELYLKQRPEELEKLVDRVGILHDAHLMAEKTMQELIDGAEKRKIHLIVSDASQAKEVLCRINLQEQISILSDIELELQGESPTFDIAVVSNSLKDNGIVLKEYSYKNNESLEDYFKRVTGGEGIA